MNATGHESRANGRRLHIVHLLHEPFPWAASEHLLPADLGVGDAPRTRAEWETRLRDEAARGGGLRGVVLVASGLLDETTHALLVDESPWPVVIVGEAPEASDEIPRLPHEILGLSADLATALLSALADSPRAPGDTLDQLVRDAVHELRTPVTIVMEFAGLLEDGVGGPLPERASGYVQQILRAADRLAGEIDDFRELFRLRGGTSPYSTRSVDIDPLLRSLASRSAGLLRYGPCVGPCWIVGDPVGIGRTLERLARGVPGLADRGRPITARCESRGAHIEVAFEFQGKAPAEFDCRLFEERGIGGAEGVTTLAGVFGLGPALAERLASRDGASLRLERSSEGGRLVLSYPRGAAVLERGVA